MGRTDRGPWVVEVRRANPLDRRADEWLWVSTCADGKTALAVVDALHNLMQSGVIKSHHLLQVRTRAASEPEPGGGRDGD